VTSLKGKREDNTLQKKSNGPIDRFEQESRNRIGWTGKERMSVRKEPWYRKVMGPLLKIPGWELRFGRKEKEQ
jgi:hypothetical protein